MRSVASRGAAIRTNTHVGQRPQVLARHRGPKTCPTRDRPHAWATAARQRADAAALIDLWADREARTRAKVTKVTSSGVVQDGVGVVRYVSKMLAHGLKAEQAPPLGWRGHRTRRRGKRLLWGALQQFGDGAPTELLELAVELWQDNDQATVWNPGPVSLLEVPPPPRWRDTGRKVMRD